ncbi:MAG: prephenate/arogenate dehydrogenase family protein [Alphaproteobacteria bacterium]|nr:prephenate/arogenate dehydrogenase family protein [Alphaproteobacteria bacterium]
MLDQITIIGMGLIGSSIARNIMKHNLAGTLVAADINQDVCDKVVELQIADKVTDNFREAVKDADMVILCVPVGAMGAAGKAIGPHLKDGCIVTDAGSVKESVAFALEPFISANVELVPAHPIAGTEFSGPESGFIELFQDRWCIITPLPNSSIRAVEKVTQLWEAFGSRVQIMDMKHHDMVLGITSHLPHLIAYTIVGTATELEDDLQSEVIKFSAGGFRDFTRIAASNPTMWRDVFLHNKEAVLELLQRFSEDLTAMQKAIRKGDGDYLYDKFSETRAIRKAIIDQGQAK